MVGNLQPGKHASKAEPKRSIHVQVESWIGGERSGRTGPPSVCLGLSWLHFSFYGQVAQSLYSRARKQRSHSSSFSLPPRKYQCLPAPPRSSTLPWLFPPPPQRTAAATRPSRSPAAWSSAAPAPRFSPHRASVPRWLSAPVPASPMRPQRPRPELRRPRTPFFPAR